MRKNKQKFWLLGFLLAGSMLSWSQSGPPPTLTSIVPNSGVQGATVSVTLTGTNFAGQTFVSESNESIGVSGVTVVSSTQITAVFTIASNAPLGPSIVS